MKEHNANVDYCGILILLRALLKQKLCTEPEAERIAARLAVQYGADIITAL